MKRQHPDNPELFWCPKCETYKARGEFHKNKLSSDNVDWKCKDCSKKRNPEKRQYAKEHKKEINAYQKEYVKINKKKLHDRRTKYRLSRLKNLSDRSCRNQKKYTDECRDIYIVAQLKQRGLRITSITIELKREQITMKRTLKQFKQWREENESDHTDVPGIEHADEINNEGGIQT